MARDRYERRHRRTARNVNCVEVMANADFDAVPSLSEAMGLEEPTLPRQCCYCGRQAEHLERDLPAPRSRRGLFAGDRRCPDLVACAERVRQAALNSPGGVAFEDDLPF
jgi:hypothetical protein